MTERVSGLYVFFDKDIREDDVQGLIDAIKWFRPVIDVVKAERNATFFDDQLVKKRLKYDLINEMLEKLK